MSSTSSAQHFSQLLVQLVSMVLSGIFSLFVGFLMGAVVVILNVSTSNYQYGIPSSVALGFFSLMLIILGLGCIVVGVRNFIGKKVLDFNLNNQNQESNSTKLLENFTIAPIQVIEHHISPKDTDEL